MRETEVQDTQEKSQMTEETIMDLRRRKRKSTEEIGIEVDGVFH